MITTFASVYGCEVERAIEEQMAMIRQKGGCKSTVQYMISSFVDKALFCLQVSQLCPSVKLKSCNSIYSPRSTVQTLLSQHLRVLYLLFLLSCLLKQNNNTKKTKQLWAKSNDIAAVL